MSEEATHPQSGDEHPDVEPGDQDRGDAAAEPPESVNRDSQPSGAGPDRLAGEMGISSEWTGGPEGTTRGFEGTGTLASSQGATDGQSPTMRDHTGARVDQDVHDEPGLPPSETQHSPDESDDDKGLASGVDRTVGEVHPNPVANKHEFDPNRNPGH